MNAGSLARTGAGGLDGSDFRGWLGIDQCDLQRGRRNFRLRLERRQHQLQFVLNEHEDVIDRGLVAIAVQRDIPFKIAIFRLQLFQHRNAVDDGNRKAGAELAEVVQEIERIGTVAEDMGVELHMQPPTGVSNRLGGQLDRRRLRRRGRCCRRPRRHDELPEIVEDRVANNRVGGLGRLDQGANVILGGQRHRDQFLGRLDLALADQLESGFEFMGKGCDLVEAKHRAGTLDGMERAESRIHQLAIVGPLA